MQKGKFAMQGFTMTPHSTIWKFAMGVIAIIYSCTGGLKSVLWTDFIQCSVRLAGVTFALF